MKINLNQDRTPSFPTDQVVGVFETEEQARAACDELSGPSFGIDEADILSGVEGARILDAAGSGHDGRGHRVRTLQHLGSNENELYAYAEVLQKGGVLLRVACTRDDADGIARVMQHHGGSGTAWFGHHDTVRLPGA